MNIIESRSYIAIPPGSTIKEILEERGITQKEFANQMGMSEKHISRLINGLVPLTNKMADKLESVLGMTARFWNGLEARYRADLIMVEQENAEGYTVEKDKLISAAEYLVHNVPEIQKMWMQKALYYAQGFSSALFGEFMFCEDCEAWVHGPVYRTVYGSSKIKAEIEGQERESDDSGVYVSSVLTPKDICVLDAVIVAFSSYSGSVLRNFTHREAPWKQARDGIADDIPSDKIISRESIKAFFCEVCKEYKIESCIDIKKYSDDMFRKCYS